MRIAGWLLLIVGALLCISIVWATIGFFMMGYGLICLLIAERRRKRAAPAAEAQVTATEPRFEPAWDVPAPAPASLPKPGATASSRATIVSSALERSRRDNSSYDAGKWDALVESDPDIARLVEALTPYGRQYVDELATVYLGLNDKNYLPAIVDQIVASARRSTSQHRTADVAAGVADAGSVRRSKNAAGRSRELLQAAGVSPEPVAVDDVAVDPDTGQEPTEIPAESSSAPVDDAVAATSEPEPPKTATESMAVTPRPVPGAEVFRATDPDDAKDLRDLFKNLG